MEKETAVECAIREVFEELGIDLTDRIDENLVPTP
jgi:8-oxo-dGTP pyrophosphatase MutT (NUDIX family)